MSLASGQVGRRALLLSLLVLVPATALARVPSNFSFVVPEGWADLSDEIQPDQLAKLHPALIESAMNGEFLAFAADLRSESDARNSFLQALLLPTGIVISQETLPTLREALFKRHEGDEAKMEMQQLDVVKIGGVDAARARWTLKGEGVDDVRLAYIIPGGNRSALLIYGATAEAFPALEPVFEKAALGTQGAEDAPRPSRTPRMLESVLTGAALLAAALLFFGRGRKSSSQPAAAPKVNKKKEQSDTSKKDEPEG